MARPAIAIALPGDERPYVVDVLREADFEPLVVGCPDDLGRASRDPPRRRRRDPRRRERLRQVARVLRAPPRERSGHPGPHGRLAAHARPVGRRGGAGRRARRVLHPALFGRVAPLARRGDAHPLGDDRRRQRCRPPERPPLGRRLVAARDVPGRLQPEGRRRQDDDRGEPGGVPGRHGPDGPPRGRGHRDRPHRELARHVERPDARRSRSPRPAKAGRTPRPRPSRSSLRRTRRVSRWWSSRRAR